MTIKMGFIGGGNMARSIIGGLLDKGQRADRVLVADINADCLSALEADLQVRTTHSNLEVFAEVDVCLLAVKPQVMLSVLEGLRNSEHSPLLISIAAGLPLETLQQGIGRALPMVRCMPNTPALLGAGASALYANAQVGDAQRELAARIMEAVGEVAWVEDEAHIDIVTALSGSGPAYFFHLVETMQRCAQQMGLSADIAAQLAVQTAYGAGRMLKESGQTPDALRIAVTSPGGTTEAALEVLEQDLARLMHSTMQAAQHRAQTLAEQLGK